MKVTNAITLYIILEKMNTNAAPNVNSGDPQMAERLQTPTGPGFPAGAREHRGVCRSWRVQLGEAGSRRRRGWPSALLWRDAGVASLGTHSPSPREGLLGAQKNFSNHKEGKSTWTFKLSVFFDSAGRWGTGGP